MSHNTRREVSPLERAERGDRSRTGGSLRPGSAREQGLQEVAMRKHSSERSIKGKIREVLTFGRETTEQNKIRFFERNGKDIEKALENRSFMESLRSDIHSISESFDHHNGYLIQPTEDLNAKKAAFDNAVSQYRNTPQASLRGLGFTVKNNPEDLQRYNNVFNTGHAFLRALKVRLNSSQQPTSDQTPSQIPETDQSPG